MQEYYIKKRGKGKHLTYHKRVKIEEMLKLKKSNVEIAKEIQVTVRTIANYYFNF